MSAQQAAYGFRLAGIDDHDGLAVHGAGRWPLLRVESRLEPDRGPPGGTVTDRDASIATPSARLVLDRATSRIAVHPHRPLHVTDLVHPCLWPAAAVFARWRGAETLHAGAFVAAGGAWAVLGERGAGKSSLLAALAITGHQILADDMLVVGERHCFAGPRCIDLRPEAAAALGIARETSTVRATQRRRLSLPAVRGRVALHGFVYLEWADRLAVEAIPPAEHLGVLVGHRRIAALGANVDVLLSLAGLPALRLSRPRHGESLEASREDLLQAVLG